MDNPLEFKKSRLVENNYRGSLSKFSIGTIVKVEAPASFLAVVEYTYADRYSKDCNLNYKLYSLIELNEEGLPIRSTAWYSEENLSLVSNDTIYGHKVIEYYYSKVKK